MKKTIISAALAIFLVAIVITILQSLRPSAPLAKPDFVKSQDGLVVDTSKVNFLVSSPLTVSGHVDGTNRWTGFEGQVGTVKLIDGNGNILAQKPLTAITDWTKFPTSFSTTLVFLMPTTTTGTLVFKNENPSGMEDYERQFSLPIKFATTTEIVKLQMYFSNNNLDPQISCEKVFPVTREIPKTLAVAKAALEELLKGPTEKEKKSGYQTSINSGVKINSLNIDKGVAKIDFNETLQKGVAGSCWVNVIRLQIASTLKQFASVNSVVISINGKSEDILQP